MRLWRQHGAPWMCLGPFKIKVKLCIKLMFLHACVINFCSFLLFSMLKFPVINITVIFYIC